MLSEKELKLEDLENSHLSHIENNENPSSEENTKGMIGIALNKEFMGLYEQKFCQFELKGMETEKMKEGC